MEQTSRADYPAAPEPAAAGEAVLREELAKWRERVPKLAAALRQRAEEADALRQELERLRCRESVPQDTAAVPAAATSPAAGIRARDELIEELQSKLAELAERHKSAQGELHTRQLTIDELRADAASWKDKWQTLTRSLDEQGDAAESAQRALDEAVAERDSLQRRNEQLFETTEMANRQITSLTDSMADLRLRLKQQRDQEARAEQVRQSLQGEIAALQSRLAAAEAGVASHVDELQTLCAAALSQAQVAASGETRLAEAREARDAAAQAAADAERRCADLAAALEEQRGEVTRLNGVIETAQRTTSDREQERRELSDQVQDFSARNRHLEEQLSERSNLVVTLEQDQAESAQHLEKLRRERDDLEEALLRAERHVKENGDHVAALDAKLERQKELIDNLEAELAEAKEEHAQALKSRPTAAAPEEEVSRLRAQVRKLEGLVRDRTDALNRERWARDLSSSDTLGGAVHQANLDSADANDAPGNREADAKLLLVLNQQLADARACNEELLARIRALEAPAADAATGAAAERAAEPARGDDLTQIHGVGDKLAEQLNELGIYRYQQIAELDEAQLEDRQHALYAHRGRILRDGWIDQAVKLVSH